MQDVQQKNLIIAESKKIDLSLKFDYDLPLIYADIRMMEKVLQNLLDNALKFTPEGGTITIGLEPQKNNMFVSVSDAGIGIGSNDLPHIFYRYQKAERTKQKDNEGLGLGLAIVKKILEVHNISISVSSNEGKGTAFSFSAPIYNSKKRVSKEIEFS